MECDRDNENIVSPEFDEHALVALILEWCELRWMRVKDVLDSPQMEKCITRTFFWGIAILVVFMGIVSYAQQVQYEQQQQEEMLYTQYGRCKSTMQRAYNASLLFDSAYFISDHGNVTPTTPLLLSAHYISDDDNTLSMHNEDIKSRTNAQIHDDDDEGSLSRKPIVCQTLAIAEYDCDTNISSKISYTHACLVLNHDTLFYDDYLIALTVKYQSATVHYLEKESYPSFLYVEIRTLQFPKKQKTLYIEDLDTVRLVSQIVDNLLPPTVVS